MSGSPTHRLVDVAVVGGGPAGATVADDLARAGADVMLIDGGDRIKPCGGAIPPLVLSEFALPESLLCARVAGARIAAPSARRVDMAIGNGFVGMVDRESFDPWLRERARASGAQEIVGRLRSVQVEADGTKHLLVDGRDGVTGEIRCRLLIGADGANSGVRRAVFGRHERPPYVFAYHEIVATPPDGSGFDRTLCEVHYDGSVSPDFYGWVFPHGGVTSVGTGTAVKGFDLRRATGDLRRRAGLHDAATLRREGAPLPLMPMRRWHDRRGVLLVGDAAGCVAPASGEGIYYAMLSGRLAAQAGLVFLASGDERVLAQPRQRFMRAHGTVFFILRMMQRFWYRNDRRRERFAAICADRDVQRLTWESYLDKKIVWRDPLAHLRVVAKDMAHVLRLAAR